MAWRFGPTLAFPVYLVFTGMLIVASGIDLECFILPDGITLGGTVLAVPAAIFALGMDWTDALLGGLVGGGTFLAVLLVFKRLRGVDGMGFGDVKLMLMLGVLCGPLGLPLITLVAGVSALAAFLLIACLMPREAPLREMPIPFGPFLSLGAFVHILAGQEILDWWIRFITG
ncbi:MAG: prepilin peptidase [Bilophila wadsworthia]